MISASHQSKTFSGAGPDGIAGAVQQAVEEGTLTQEMADQVVRAFNESTAGSPSSSNGDGFYGDGPSKAWSHFSFSESDGRLAEVMRQAVEKGVIAQETADRIVLGFDDDGPSTTWHHFSFSGEDGFAGALLEAVEEGVITQEMADQILRSLDGEDTGG